MALCDMLAFWTSRDAMQMDRLFRQSGLIRDKWIGRNQAALIGALTIEEAICRCDTVYDPNSPEAREKRTTHAAEVFTRAITMKVFFRINPVETPESRKRYTFDDRGNGYLFADSFKNLCRYCPEAKEWFHYTARFGSLTAAAW
jgi:putative DNA primase/helicase